MPCRPDLLRVGTVFGSGQECMGGKQAALHPPVRCSQHSVVCTAWCDHRPCPVPSTWAVEALEAGLRGRLRVLRATAPLPA